MKYLYSFILTNKYHSRISLLPTYSTSRDSEASFIIPFPLQNRKKFTFILLVSDIVVSMLFGFLTLIIEGKTWSLMKAIAIEYLNTKCSKLKDTQ